MIMDLFPIVLRNRITWRTAARKVWQIWRRSTKRVSLLFAASIMLGLFSCPAAAQT
jgi:hypothetical protein